MNRKKSTMTFKASCYVFGLLLPISELACGPKATPPGSADPKPKEETPERPWEDTGWPKNISIFLRK